MDSNEKIITQENAVCSGHKSCYEQNIKAIENYFAAGSKEAARFRIGLEIEHFVVGYDPANKQDSHLIFYDTGLKELIEAMLDLCSDEATPLIIDGQLMGLEGKSTAAGRTRRQELLSELLSKNPTRATFPDISRFFSTSQQALQSYLPLDISAQEIPSPAHCSQLLSEDLGFAVSLEPASQFEISVGPSKNVYQAQEGLKDFYALFALACERCGIYARLETRGYNPYKDARELPLIAKERYRLMDEHFAKRGIHGIDMMRGSASTQVSLDFSSEQNFVKRYRLACALGPVFAFLFDNASAQHVESLKHTKRMVRSEIWRDTDSVRCGVPPTLFDTSFGFADYTRWVLSVPAIVFTTDEGQSIDTHNMTIDQLIDTDEPLSKHDIEHLLSMVFPNTRLKNFIEIRDVDSLPAPFVTSYAALVEGLIYNDEVGDKVCDLIGMKQLTVDEISQVRTRLMQEGWEAQVYGMGVQELCMKLLDYAKEALFGAAQSDKALSALACDANMIEAVRPLVEAKLSITELLGMNEDKHVAHSPELSALWRLLLVQDSKHEKEQSRLHEELEHSYAQKRGLPIHWTVTPKLISAPEHRRFKEIAERCHRIMEQASQAFIDKPELRAAFKLDPEIEELSLLERGYTSLIPLARVDIFYNEKSGAWKFCELNTDGSSGQVFMHETERILSTSSFAKRFMEHRPLMSYSTAENWANTLIEIYKEYANNKGLTQDNAEPLHLALLDWEESITAGELFLFKDVFATHGVMAHFVDIRSLHIKDDKLCGCASEISYDKQALLKGFSQEQSKAGDVYYKKIIQEDWPLDVIWRRAVTSEMLEKPDAGSQALIEACKQGIVCSVGSFITHLTGIKEFLPLMAGELGCAILNPEDQAFIADHCPRTLKLNNSLELDDFISDKDAWIIKAAEGYGGSGIYAGKDYSVNVWRDLIRRLAAQDAYVIQEYITPYKSYELDAEAREFERFDNLLGLYLFKGVYSGILQRIGKQSTITTATGGYYQPVFIAASDEEFDTTAHSLFTHITPF